MKTHRERDAGGYHEPKPDKVVVVEEREEDSLATQTEELAGDVPAKSRRRSKRKGS